MGQPSCQLDVTLKDFTGERNSKQAQIQIQDVKPTFTWEAGEGERPEKIPGPEGRGIEGGGGRGDGKGREGAQAAPPESCHTQKPRVQGVNGPPDR